MPATPELIDAYAHAESTGDCLRVEFRGRWRITSPRPSWTRTLATLNYTRPTRVELALHELCTWDSALILYLNEARQWCGAHDATCVLDALPPAIRRLSAQLASAPHSRPAYRSHDFLTTVGLATQDVWKKVADISHFVGEAAMSVAYLAKHPHRFRWRDCLHEMQQCGAMALPIVGLIAFLVGVTLAYTGAVILRQFGGDIWVADLVGLTMLREMGAVMTGIVVAGRTGAAFAAQLGNMKANEEIDALTTLGIRPIDFLVLPRLIALFFMMPLLALYANALGILGGAVIAYGLLDIPPTAYWVELLTAIGTSDLLTGLIKAATFGLFVGLAGCLRGLQAERSAAGVGAAATSAVVTSILLIIVGDALYAVIFNILGW